MYQNPTFIIATPAFFHIAFFTLIKKAILAEGQQYFHFTENNKVHQVQNCNLWPFAKLVP